MAGQQGDAVRLSDGVWVLPDPDGPFLGILGGDIDHGWRSHVEQLDDRDRPAVVRALNLGHAFTTDQIAVRTDRRGVVLDLAGGHHAVLDDAAAARLQIICAGAPRRAVPDRDGSRPLPVGSARGGLRVYDVPPLGLEPRVEAVVATGDAVVTVHVVSSSGPFVLPLPALPVLLAAAEAACDGTAMTLWLNDLGGAVSVVEVDAPAAQQAAADAQWLIPALRRQQEQTGSHNP